MGWYRLVATNSSSQQIIVQGIVDRLTEVQFIGGIGVEPEGQLVISTVIATTFLYVFYAIQCANQGRGNGGGIGVHGVDLTVFDCHDQVFRAGITVQFHLFNGLLAPVIVLKRLVVGNLGSLIIGDKAVRPRADMRVLANVTGVVALHLLPDVVGRYVALTGAIGQPGIGGGGIQLAGDGPLGGVRDCHVVSPALPLIHPRLHGKQHILQGDGRAVVEFRVCREGENYGVVGVVDLKRFKKTGRQFTVFIHPNQGLLAESLQVQFAIGTALVEEVESGVGDGAADAQYAAVRRRFLVGGIRTASRFIWAGIPAAGGQLEQQHHAQQE